MELILNDADIDRLPGVSKRMRIVFSTDYYSEGMGYSENILPRTLAARGCEVFVVSSTMQVYGDHDFYKEAYGRFLGPAVVEPCEKMIDGVTLIRLPIFVWWKRFRIATRRTRRILGLKPDIVYAWDPRAFHTVMLSLASWFFPFKLFTAVHTVASVFPAYFSFGTWSLRRRIYLRLTETLLGWISCRRVAVCYATTPDAADIAIRFMGAPKENVRHLPLGFDNRLFHPLRDAKDRQDREAVRSELGFEPHEIVCVYTGRLTEAKNPYCLAAAIEILRGKGLPFRGLFFGEGEQHAKIAAVNGCRLEPFVPHERLARIYCAVDIGVWPRQESISMTDAAACGVPIVVSDRVKAVERFEGNGLTYEENDPAALANVLGRLQDFDLRSRLGRRGAEKMQGAFTVDRMADILLADFEAALGRHKAPQDTWPSPDRLS
jgi:glycosyltransferase involved in cell wall biosynthesis